jgi:hypothetical protein
LEITGGNTPVTVQLWRRAPAGAREKQKARMQSKSTFAPRRTGLWQPKSTLDLGCATCSNRPDATQIKGKHPSFIHREHLENKGKPAEIDAKSTKKLTMTKLTLSSHYAVGSATALIVASPPSVLSVPSVPFIQIKPYKAILSLIKHFDTTRGGLHTL